MSLDRVKSALRWLFSFIKPQPLRQSVMLSGAEATGVVIKKSGSAKMYAGLATYQPYPLPYILIGTEPGKGNPSKVVYRFFDPESKTEFLLTKPLVDLLLFKIDTSDRHPPDIRDAVVKDTQA